ncbi:MAG: HTH-type transcriptional regulator BhcR [Paracoccaceae bacterium]
MESSKRPRGRPKSLFKESSAGTLQSLDRALNILTSVARSEAITLSDLARDTEVPTATTHRILTTLQNHGFVKFDTGRQEWSVGVEAYRTGAAFLRRNSVVEIGQPVLRRLMEETGETANLAVPDKGEVVFVGQVETPNPIRAFFPPGSRSSMHASGIGKAILAAFELDVLRKTLNDMSLTAYTQSTNSEPVDLNNDLDRIRIRGWSHDDEERYVGMSCVGACIFDDAGLPCAGVSVSGPTARFTGDQAAVFGRKVAAAAREITLASGGREPEEFARRS